MAGASAPKRERLEARITEEQKETLARAAALTGMSVTDFVVLNAERAARATIREHEVMELSVRDTRALMAALLNPPEPNAALLRSAERYRRLVVPRRRATADA